MNLLKALLHKLPGGRRLTESVSYRRRSRKLAKIGDTEDRFTHIFDENKWRDSESVSGAGSSLAATGLVREQLRDLLADLEVGTLLDAPCGDYNWFQHVTRPAGMRYIGADIVSTLIDINRQNFSDDMTEFVHLDIIEDRLPRADLWLCRDCLIHLSYDDIASAMDRFAGSEIPYLLTTTHRRVRRNTDIPTGHCRMINLEISPFDFPPPLQFLDEDDLENTGKSLALWHREQLQQAAEKLRDRGP